MCKMFSARSDPPQLGCNCGLESIFSQKVNTPRRTSVVPTSPVDGSWRCKFTGPEGASAAVEIVEDSSILSEKVIAHVHSSSRSLQRLPVASIGHVSLWSCGTNTECQRRGLWFSWCFSRIVRLRWIRTRYVHEVSYAGAMSE
jgi:hypothetical protein